MAWIVLFTAGVLEIVWAVGLNYKGFTRLWPSVATVSAMAASLALLGVAVGTVGTVLAGIWLFGESAAFIRLFCVFLILAGMTGLKLLTET